MRCAVVPIQEFPDFELDQQFQLFNGYLLISKHIAEHMICACEPVDRFIQISMQGDFGAR